MAEYILRLINDGIDYSIYNDKLSEYVEIGQNKKTILLDKEGTKSIDLSLHKMSFHRKVYEPGLIDATIQISVDTSSNMPTIQEVHDMFMRKVVELDEGNTEIASKYYVHEVSPRYENANGTSMYVDLKIYSIDNLMRINKFSEAYLGREMRKYIATEGIKDYVLNVDTFDGEKKPYYINLSENDVLQNLSYGGEEFIQPYLVQYNETFYDFLARVCNRCGEFMYFENGELHVGLHTDNKDTKQKKLHDFNNDDDKKKFKSIAYKNITEDVLSVKDYAHDSLKYEIPGKKYGNLNEEPKTKFIDHYSSFNVEQVEETGAYPETNPTTDGKPTKIYNYEVPNDEFFMPLYRDRFAGSVISNALTKNVGAIVSGVLDIIAGDNTFDKGLAVAEHAIEIESKAAIKADEINKGGNKIINTWAGSDAEMGAPFADNNRNRWTTLSYYSDIKCNEESQERKMVSVDMGDAYEDLRLGNIVTLPYDKDNKYVIVEVENDVEKTGSGTNTTYISSMRFKAVPLKKLKKGDETSSGWKETTNNNKIIEYTDTGNGTFKFYPPLLKTGAFRQSEPQHAIVIDSDDPKNQGRVRIRFPWQRKVDESMLETDDPQVKKLVEKKKNLEKRRDSINDMSSANGNSSDDNKKKFKNNIKKVQKWKKECESEITELETKINELTEAINGKFNSNNNLVKDGYKQKLNNLKADKEAKEARNGVIDKTIEGNNKTIEENNKTIEENNKAIEENNTVIENNNTAIEENNTAIEENGDPNGEKEKGNENLNEENENLKEENKKLKEKNEELEEKNKNLKEDNENKKKEKSDNNVVIEQYHKYESEKAECERMLSYYKTEKELYDDEKDVYETFLEDLLNIDNEKDFDGLIKLKTIDDNLEKQFKKNKKKALKSIEKVIDEIEKEIKKIVPKPMALLEAGTPWIRMVTPMATNGGGMYFKPEKGDEVLVEFENGNVERPYVVGTLYSKNVVAPEGNRIIKSPNGHYIKIDDPVNISNLLGTVLPAFAFMKQWGLMPPKLDLNSDDAVSNLIKSLMGGITLSDGLNMCQIGISGHERKITINSTIGDVEISSLTGITIKSHGDIKIEGKNIDITAGNRLTLTSGTNLYKNPRATEDGSTAVERAESIVKRTEQLIGGTFDLSLIRCIAEIILKPVNGTLQIKSHSFLKLEAGEGNAEIPVTSYKTKYLADTTINKGHNISGYQTLQYILNTIYSLESRLDQMIRLHDAASQKLAELYIRHDGKIFGEEDGNLIKKPKDGDEFVNMCCGTWGKDQKMNKFTLWCAVKWHNYASYHADYKDVLYAAYYAIREFYKFCVETVKGFQQIEYLKEAFDRKLFSIGNTTAAVAAATATAAAAAYEAAVRAADAADAAAAADAAYSAADADYEFAADAVAADAVAAVNAANAAAADAFAAYLAIADHDLPNSKTVNDVFTILNMVEFDSQLKLTGFLREETGRRLVAKRWEPAKNEIKIITKSLMRDICLEVLNMDDTSSINSDSTLVKSGIKVHFTDGSNPASFTVADFVDKFELVGRSAGGNVMESNTLGAALGGKLMKYFDEKLLTYSPESDVWSSDAKPRILMSEGSDTMLFKHDDYSADATTRGVTIEESRTTARLDKPLDLDAATRNLRELLKKLL